MKLSFTVNRMKISLKADPQRRLLDILRDDLQLSGAKEGCGKGECGSCTVLMDRRPVNSCLVPALQLEGRSIVTVEGLQEWPLFRELEQAFIDHGAVQCGFCIPGYVISTVAFLRENKPPYYPEQVQQGLAGNICRCTGYTKILEVVRDIEQRPDVLKKIDEMLAL